MTPADAREIGDRLERKWWFKLVTETIKERDEAIKERDEAIEQLRQVKAQKLQAVKVLVGVDECCEACTRVYAVEGRCMPCTRASEHERLQREWVDDE